MKRVCIDTNVWLSGLVFTGAPSRIVDLALEKKFHLIISDIILNEIEKNLINKFQVSPTHAAELRKSLMHISDIYEPKGIIHVVKEKLSDNLILETAVIGNVDYLVTGDKRHLLPIKFLEVFRFYLPMNF